MMNNNLRAALNLVNNYLNNFANSSNFANDFDLAFGDKYDRNLVSIFKRQWQTKTFTIPPIEVVQDRVLGTAIGAFAASNNTIYISDTLVNSGDIDRLTAVLIEELGHSIDARINTRDSAGDEGEIFSNLVRGNRLSATQIAGLKAEDDRGIININGRSIVVEQANPTAGNDTLDGTSGNDTIDGLAGNDIINGLAGDDSLNGGAGDDTINAGTGNTENVVGGTGNDLLIINYSSSNTRIFPLATLVDNGANGYSGSYSDTTTNYTVFSEIERFDITGGSGNDNLVGGKNNDALKGGAGNDVLDGGGGTDTIDGGAGNDTAIINLSTQTIALTASVGTGAVGGVTFSNIEAFNLTTGSGNDSLTGGGLNDTLVGGAGNDTMNGLAGDDSLNGGAGDDIINAGTGNTENVVGGTGNDLLIINYSSSPTGLFPFPSNTLVDNGANGYSGSYSDTTNYTIFSEIERFDITGGSGDDYLLGGKNNDALKGGAGGDFLDGGLGADTLDGGLGADTFGFGGVGITTVAGLGVDSISTFVANTDKIQLHKSTFSAITTAAGASIGTNFISVADDTLVAAQTAAIIYSLASGGLFYNADAATPGSGANGGQFAILPTGLTLSPSDFVVVDDTVTLPTITLSVAPATVNENSTTNLTYTFTRTGATTNALTVNYGVGGTATLGTDYAQTGAATFAASAGTVTFAAGATTAIVTIDPTTDTIFETNETVLLTLASGAGYSVGTTTAVTGTIVNDDLLPAISIADLTIVEGINGNPTQSLITVSLSNASSQAVSVNYATSNVTAIAGTDYTATTGILTFAAGQTSKTIAVPILNDNLNEANETFNVTLTTPTNATIADNQATITITDTLLSNVTTILPALVENLTLTGTAAINATGNAGNNVLTGNSANNSYIFDADLAQGQDTINETSTGGIDTLNLSQTAAAVNINLGLTTAQTVNANLKLVIPVITLENFIGGSGNDRITGNSLNNSLDGGSGDDRIFAGGGNDFLVGGGGSDVISGGAGNDIFAYSGLLSGATTATGLFGVDAIYDFTSTQDKISLSKATFSTITSAAGTAIGANFITVDDDSLVAAQSASIVYSLSSGGLFYNQNGNATGYGTNGGEFANILGSTPLVSSDFSIVA
jgi:Ca2+-binding RTX toxin-like protein